MAYDLEAALVEFDRWGAGSKFFHSKEAEHRVLRLSDDGYSLISVHRSSMEADEAMNRARLEASIKAALGQFAEIAA